MHYRIDLPEKEASKRSLALENREDSTAGGQISEVETLLLYNRL